MVKKVCFFLFIIGLIVVTFVYSKEIESKLNQWRVLPEPEKFTELYFTDHTKLPKNIQSDQTYPFSFTVHNLEYKDMEYDYVVRAASPSGTVLLHKGIISAKQDQYRNINEEIQLKFGKVTTPVKTEVIVNLTNLNQEIHFWTEVHN